MSYSDNEEDDEEEHGENLGLGNDTEEDYLSSRINEFDSAKLQDNSKIANKNKASIKNKNSIHDSNISDTRETSEKKKEKSIEFNSNKMKSIEKSERIDYKKIMNGKEKRTTVAVENLNEYHKVDSVTYLIDKILGIKSERRNRIYNMVYKPPDKDFWVINFISCQFLLSFYYQFNDRQEESALIEDNNEKNTEKKIKIYFCSLQGKNEFERLEKSKDYGPITFDDYDNAENYFFHNYHEENHKIYPI